MVYNNNMVTFKEYLRRVVWRAGVVIFGLWGIWQLANWALTELWESYIQIDIYSWINIALVVFICFNIWGFHRMVKERNVAKENEELYKQNLYKLQRELEKSTILSHDYIADTYIRGQLIYLMNLLAPGAKPIISDRTIEDCEIRGPAMIALLGRVTIKNSTFNGDAESLFVEVADKRLIFGAIGLRDCVFRRCRFAEIGIIGTREQIDRAKQGFTPSAS
jgi:hypothetical protein